MTTNWGTIFDRSKKEEGASSDLLAEFQLTALQQLTADEVRDANASQRNPLPANDPLHSIWKSFDANNWVMPAYRFPCSYLSFLQWSNGGDFEKGGRDFNFFPAIDSKIGVRAMMLAYQIPEYMNYAVPFAFDGAGAFYLFDMRQPPIDDEFPIVLAHSGSLGWDADNFEILGEGFAEALTNAS